MPFLPDLMVEARDGVSLATDVTLPEGPGPFPVILERTPYGKHLASRSEIDVERTTPWSRTDMAARFAAHGYAVVVQDCRGRHGSEGVFAKYLSEAEDGHDTCSWIMRQPWCDGRIGTMGLSYAAHTQMALACTSPPGLVTMILDSGGFSNAMTSGIRQGGAFELKQATWAYRQALESPAAKADPATKAALKAEDIFAWFRRMPWSEGNSPVRHVPEYESYLLDQWRRGTFDAGWAKAGLWSLGFVDAIPDIPVLLMSSWLDVYVRATFENLDLLTRPPRRAPVHLIMGPWTHGDRTKRVFGAADFGAGAPLDAIDGRTWFDLRLAWFERHLKGRVDVPAPPKARVFVMGGGSGAVTRGVRDIGGAWVAAEAWPPPGAVETAWHEEFCVRPRRAGADDRRGADLRRPRLRRWPAGSARGAGFLRKHGRWPPLGGAIGRGGVRDRAAAGRRGDRRPGCRAPVRFGRCAGCRHHREACRRAPGWRRLRHH
jgi:putative CocE/NonD family hydrolase